MGRDGGWNKAHARKSPRKGGLPTGRPKPLDVWLTIGGVVVGLVLFLVPKTPASVTASCVVICLLMIHPVWNFWWIERSQTRRGFALVVLVSAVCGLGGLAWPGAKLVISMGFDMRSDSREKSGGMWYVRQDYIAPVNSALLVRISNTSDAYASVEKFAFSLQNTITGKWTEIYTIRSPGKLYCCVNDKNQLNELHEIQLDGGGLFRILQNGAVAPHAQITNWFLFEFPKGFISDGMEAARLEVWDNTGRRYEVDAKSPATHPVEMSDIPTDVRDEMDRITFKAVNSPIVNLSGLRVSHVADEPR